MSSEHSAISTAEAVSARNYPCPAQRAHSDSVIPSCWTASPATAVNPSANDEVSIKSQALCTCGDYNQPRSSQTSNASLLQRAKARQNLQLPSFRSLGIAAGIVGGQPEALVAGALPTPPEETTAAEISLTSLPCDPLSRSISFPENILPRTPGCHEYSNVRPATDSDEATHDMPQQTSSPTSHVKPAKSINIAYDTSLPNQNTLRGGSGGQQPGDSSSDDDADDGGFMAGAIPFTSRIVTDIDAPVLHAMCYIQPCPLAGAETAFDPILADMESNAKRLGKYIEVTYQMPPKFNMNQIPSSPAATPIATDQGMVDYFSNHVYTRGIVAKDYETAMAQAGSSSPRPAVAPGSINVAMLERYIPPPSLDEYTNLFSTDMPSALVDRLFELSPKNGTCVFVYPTAEGARTFLASYLRPLLDPVLRTIASTHDLSADFPASVGALASLQGDLLTFDRTLLKLNALLRKLSRPPPSSSSVTTTTTSTTTAAANTPPRPTPTFTVVHASPSVVDIGKDTLVNWWLEQEKPRIRKAVDRYFHARRLESTMGMTAKIENGLRRREWDDYEGLAGFPSEGGLERSGIEVGVYVVRRTG